MEALFEPLSGKGHEMGNGNMVGPVMRRCHAPHAWIRTTRVLAASLSMAFVGALGLLATPLPAAWASGRFRAIALQSLEAF